MRNGTKMDKENTFFVSIKKYTHLPLFSLEAIGSNGYKLLLHIKKKKNIECAPNNINLFIVLYVA